MQARASTGILVVEDERIVANDIQLTLCELGYDAFAVASSAEEAIARASDRCPDLVLMDIRICGERDGIETAELLRQRFGVPIVYLTAHADDATIARARHTEPYGYLVKPVKRADLRSAVEVSLYRFKVERQLRERERWFATTLRSIADAVIVVDCNGCVTFMNPPAEALTGASATTAIGRPVHEVLVLTDQALAQDAPVLAALREGRAIALQDSRLRNIKNGTLHLISDSAAPVIDADEVLGAVMVSRDVTDHRRTQMQLEIADRSASLGTLAAGVAHEINNPLAAIIANVDLMSELLNELRPLPLPDLATRRLEVAREALSDVQLGSSRIRRIVSDLSTFAQPKPIGAGIADVRRCIDWAVQTTAHETRHRAKVVVHVGTVPQVKADEGRVGQVLLALLLNAAHAIAPGDADRNEITVTATTSSSGDVLIQVMDSGAGIPKSVLSRVFDPFFTTKEPGTGAGLGLSISHGIVRALGGKIEIESDEGGGTLVRVELPAAGSRPSLSLVPASAKAPAALRADVLVVDDEDMVRRTIARVLASHSLTCVASAQEALALLNTGRRFDLILCDLMMPSMTGVELFDIVLREHPQYASKIVFLSGGALSEGAAGFLDSVSNRRIAKPFNARELERVVQAVLEQQRLDR